MRFTTAECNIMGVSWKQTSHPHQYELSGQVLEEVKDTMYLGVTVSDILEWTKHIDVITAKANSKLSFLWRNLKGNPKKRETVHVSLLRSFLEYSATVWHPCQKYSSENWRWCSTGCLFCERHAGMECLKVLRRCWNNVRSGFRCQKDTKNVV